MYLLYSSNAMSFHLDRLNLIMQAQMSKHRLKVLGNMLFSLCTSKYVSKAKENGWRGWSNENTLCLGNDIYNVSKNFHLYLQ